MAQQRNPDSRDIWVFSGFLKKEKHLHDLKHFTVKLIKNILNPQKHTVTVTDNWGCKKLHFIALTYSK